MPVVVEYLAAGLTWAYGTGKIGAHGCLPGLPAASDSAVLARSAGPVLIGQGRGGTRAARHLSAFRQVRGWFFSPDAMVVRKRSL
jgi:hypothetical protein